MIRLLPNYTGTSGSRFNTDAWIGETLVLIRVHVDLAKSIALRYQEKQGVAKTYEGTEILSVPFCGRPKATG